MNNPLSITYSPKALRNIYTQDTTVFLSKSPISVISVTELGFNNNRFHGEEDHDYIENHNNGNNFKYEEFILAKSLAKFNLISNNYRHGEKEAKECDIVDTERNLQIEVATELKTNSKITNSTKFQNGIFLGSSASNIDEISKALINKFDSKNYTNLYTKGICILSFGDNNSTAIMSTLIRNNILKHRPNASKNFFEKIYLFSYNITSSQYHLHYIEGPDDELHHRIITDLPEFITRKSATIHEIDQQKWYLITVKNTTGKHTRLVVKGSRIGTFRI